MGKLRAKVLPQDPVYLPQEGIRLFKENASLRPVPAADFRVDALQLDKVLTDLTRWLKTMPAHLSEEVAKSWSELDKKLKGLVRDKDILPEMDIRTLPKQAPVEVASVPGEYQFVEEEGSNVPSISGEFCE